MMELQTLKMKQQKHISCAMGQNKKIKTSYMKSPTVMMQMSEEVNDSGNINVGKAFEVILCRKKPHRNL